MSDSRNTDDPKDPDLHRKRADGQNEKYLVLSDEERAKGYLDMVKIVTMHKQYADAMEAATLPQSEEEV